MIFVEMAAFDAAAFLGVFDGVGQKVECYLIHAKFIQ
jgi:hypothetical protein